MLSKIKNVVTNACAINNCKVNVEIRPGYPPTINDIKSAKLAAKIFRILLEKIQLIQKKHLLWDLKTFHICFKKNQGHIFG